MSPSPLFPSVLSLLRAMLLACALAAASTSAQAGTKTYTVTAPDGVTLAVRESGDAQGAPVIFVHGLLGSTLNWEAQVGDPRLQRYRLISYDMRGHGLSGKPAGAEAYRDGRRWADDLQAVIKSSRAAKPVLVGWSLGGAVRVSAASCTTPRATRRSSRRLGGSTAIWPASSTDWNAERHAGSGLGNVELLRTPTD